MRFARRRAPGWRRCRRCGQPAGLHWAKEPREHGGGRLAVLRPSGAQDEIDRPAFGVDERMDFRREATAGTSHATIIGAPFLLWPHGRHPSQRL